MSNNNNIRYVRPQSRRRSKQELVLYTRLKAVLCMVLFALAVAVCVKVIQNMTANGALAVDEPDGTVQTRAGAAADTDSGDEIQDDNKLPEIANVPEVAGIPKEEKGGNDKENEQSEKEHTIEVIDGITYVDDILIANKTYSLPEDYNPGLLPEAENAFYEMAAAAANDGISLFISSGFRSHWTQVELYNEYVSAYGEEAADTFSSRPGHSEHQTGLTIDVNNPSDSFAGTPEAKWLEENCTDYGFIIRYPEGKEDITGYEYEPWHIRYLGVDIAKDVEASGLCLEEYLGIDSEYKD